MEAAIQPHFAQIEPVGQCNLRCRMCAIQFRRDGPPHGPPAFMDYATFTRIIDELPALRELHLQGLGEPLMHPRFFDMVRYAAEKGVRVSTNTNLTLLNPQRARLCVSSGLAEIHVSLDGATAETFERIRVRAHHDRVLCNLRRLMAARRALASDTPQVRMITVLMRQNLDELPALVQQAHRFGIERIFVQHLCHDFSESELPAQYRPLRRFVEQQSLLGESPQRVEHCFDEARRSAERLGVDLRLPRTQPRAHVPGTPGPKRCDWPWKGPYISYDGKSMPCCMISTPDRVNFGDVGENGVNRTWNGADYADFRRRLASEQPPEVCAACAIYQGIF